MNRPEKGIIPLPGQNPADFILIATKDSATSSLGFGEGSRIVLSVSGGTDDDEEDGLFSPGSGDAGETSETGHYMSILAGDVTTASGSKWKFSQMLRSSWKGEGGAKYAVGFWAQVIPFPPSSRSSLLYGESLFVVRFIFSRLLHALMLLYTRVYMEVIHLNDISGRKSQEGIIGKRSLR